MKYTELELKHIILYSIGGLTLMADGEVECELEGFDFHERNTIIAERINYKLSEVKPILRTLESLTKDELDEFSVNFRMYYQRDDFDVNLMIVKDYNLALELNLDLFGLIESGLAIDLNTINK
jgi:hypothetical protein